MERDRRTSSRERLVEGCAEDEQAWESRNGNGEAIRLGRLELDLVRIHRLPSLSPCMVCSCCAARIRPPPRPVTRPLVPLRSEPETLTAQIGICFHASPLPRRNSTEGNRGS